MIIALCYADNMNSCDANITCYENAVSELSFGFGRFCVLK